MLHKSRPVEKLGNSLFLFIGFTIGQLAAKPSLLVTFWILLVSFILVEIFQSQLLTELTKKVIDYPDSFDRLYESKNDLKILVTTDSGSFLRKSKYSKFKELDKIGKTKRISDMIEILELLSNGKTVFIAKSTVIDSITPLMNFEKYAILEEKHQFCQYMVMVEKRFRYHKGVLIM